MNKKEWIKRFGSLFFSFILSVLLITGLYPEAVWAGEETSAVTGDSSEEDTLQAGDKDTADKDVADKDAADKDAADKDTEDNDTADKDAADKDAAEKDTAEKDADEKDADEKDQGTDKESRQILSKKNELVKDGVVGTDTKRLPALSKGEVQSFQKLNVQMSRSGDNALRLIWNQVPGADGYELYGGRCNTTTRRYETVMFTTLTSPTMTAWMCENLKKNTYYKFVVRAYILQNGTKTYLARSPVTNMSTGGDTYDMIEGVKVEKDNVTLSVGKTAVIKATLETSGKKLRLHQSLNYESDKPAVATVNRKGRIRAKKKGTCTIYVYAQNGKYTTVKVTVK